MIQVAIIGAGIAGLACARRLVQSGLHPVVFDKGRGIGGRVATRRFDALQFDHGAQYVTAKGPGFAAVLDDLAASGAAAQWSDGSGQSKAVGTPGMSALARALGAGLDIRQNAQVRAIAQDGTGWVLRVGEDEYRAERVVITAPAPQAAALLGTEHPLAKAMAQVRYAPCLTLMAATTAPGPFVTRKDAADPLAWIAQDNSKPGRPVSDSFTWVAQASETFSSAHLEGDAGAMVALMLPLLCDRLGLGAHHITHAVAHRWRYARVTTALGQPFLRTADGTLYLGGDGYLGPRVEAAWTSGTAIAGDVLGAVS